MQEKERTVDYVEFPKLFEKPIQPLVLGILLLGKNEGVIGKVPFLILLPFFFPAPCDGRVQGDSIDPGGLFAFVAERWDGFP